MTPTQKLDQLTFTRFLAALSVLFFHGGRQWGILSYLPMLTAGPTAVSFFYVLSGFVMTIAYYRPNTRLDLGSYALARFSRIYPVYILSFVLTCVYYIELIARTKSRELLVNIFLLQAWSPEYVQSFNIAAWSLSVEAFFYLLFPLLLLGLSRFSSQKVTFAALVFWGISQFTYSALMVFEPDSLHWLAYFPLFHLNAFFLGVAGGMWFLSEKPRVTPKASISLTLVFFSFGVVLLMLSLREYFPASFTTLSLDVGSLSPFFLILILALAMDHSFLSKLFSHPWLVLLGDASYALYILHVPFRWLLEKLLHGTGMPISYNLFFGIYAIAAVALSVLVFKYIERPARDWLRQKPWRIPLMVLDGMMIVGLIALAYYLRLGDGVAGFIRTQNFSIRVGVVLFFISLLVFRTYMEYSWQRLVLATFSAGLALTGLMYSGWKLGWVEGFPRPIILLLTVFVFCYLFVSRFLIQRFDFSRSNLRS